MTLALLIAAVTSAWADNVLYATVDESTMTLMFGEKPDGAYVHDAYNSDWSRAFCEEISTVVVDASCRNYDGNTTRYLFYGFKYISSIEGLSNLNTENVTQMGNMFQGCESLTSIDLSNFNTAKVTSMYGMFNSCEALPSIDLSSFNTAEVTLMANMFANCSSLTTITVGEGWNTDKVTNSREMFKSCSKLPNFNSGKTDKTNAFAGEGGYLTAASGSAGTFSINEDDKTEATMKMPQLDLTATYTIKRDMTIDMPVTVQDAEQNSRFRVQKQGNAFQPVGMDAQQVAALFKVHDDIEGKDLTINTDYTIQIFAADEDGNATGNAMTLDAFTYAPGDYVAKAVAVDGSNYSGITAQSNLFTLFQGYEISVAAGEYATFYKDEALYVEDTDAQLYTITAVGNATATATELSVAAANTPLLVKNNASETKTILLIPTTDKTPDSVTPATEFKGTLTATQIAASTTTQNNYAWNGLKFVWVKNALAIGANKCWLEVGSGKNAARALTIVFGDGDTTGIDSTERTENADDEWYDLSGHKLQAAPKRKGVYIRNGRKEVVK